MRSAGSLDSLIGALSVSGGSNEYDARAVREYILSRDVLRRLDIEEGLSTTTRTRR